MLLQRVITAVVLLAIIVGTLYLSNEAFLIALSVAFAITFYEWLRIEKLSQSTSLILSFVLFCPMAYIAHKAINPAGFLLILNLLVSCMWLAITALCFNARKTGFRLKRSTSLTMAVLFVGAAYLSMVYLMREGGWPLVLSVFAIVWVADIFAYFFGIAFGKHKMAPAISPKKSWEGAAGAYGCAFIAALLAWIYLPHEMVLTSRLLEAVGPVAGILMVVILVSVSIAGDLFESDLKRQAGVKDSGKLLPGHGGFYDRLDSAVAVFPVATTLLLIL